MSVTGVDVPISSVYKGTGSTKKILCRPDSPPSLKLLKTVVAVMRLQETFLFVFVG